MKQFVLLLCLLGPSVLMAELIEIRWWHSMTASRGKVLNELANKFNQSQKKYKLTAEYKGNYTESLNASIAAYRGNRQPHIVQVFEVGTLTMMNSGAIYPVEDLLSKHGKKMDWSNFIDPVLAFYQSSEGKLLSMPFNTSTPVMFYNQDILKQAGIKDLPNTWEDLFSTTEKVVKTTKSCGMVVGWQSWVLVENFNSIHNLPLATKANGFDGLDTKLVFNHPLLVDTISKLQMGQKRRLFSYEGRRSDPARSAFVAGKCAFHMDSSSSYGTLKKQAKFKFGVVPLPHWSSQKPKNSIIGGATLWVFNGHKEKEYQGVAEFLHFLGRTDNQMWWHKQTGYLPITKKAYYQLAEEGYYKKVPEQEIAIKQMLRGNIGPNNRGIRLGNFTQIREIINDELENIWAGKQSAQDGLAKAVHRGNRVLRYYERQIKRKKR